jgi:thiol:disulfide interchange protein DsbD
VQPVLPGSLALALWGVLAIGAATLVVANGRSPAALAQADAVAPAPSRMPRLAWRHALGVLLGLVGVLQIVGAAAGGTDPLKPLARFLRAQRARPARRSAAASPRCAASRARRRAGVGGQGR